MDYYTEIKMYDNLQKIKGEVRKEMHTRSFLDLDSKYYESSFMKDVRHILETVPKESKILEVGCGRGILAALLSSLGYKHVHAIDVKYTENVQTGSRQFNNRLSKKLLHSSALLNREKIWKRLSSFYNVSYSYYSDKFPFKDDTFDYVIAYAVIEHVEEKYMENFLDEIKRILKKNSALMVFKCPRRLSYVEFASRTLGIPCHKQLYSKSELLKRLGKHNFNVATISKTDILPAFFPWNQNLYNAFYPVSSISSKVLELTPLRIFSHHWRCTLKNGK